MKLIFNSYFMLLYLSNIFNTREMAPVIFFILSLSFSILCSPYLVSSIYDEEMAPPIPFTLFFILLLLFAFLIQLVSFITKRWRHRYHLHYFLSFSYYLLSLSNQFYLRRRDGATNTICIIFILLLLFAFLIQLV